MKGLAPLLLVVGILLLGGAVAGAVWGYYNPEAFSLGSTRASKPFGYFVLVGMLGLGAAAVRGWAKMTGRWVGDD